MAEAERAALIERVGLFEADVERQMQDMAPPILSVVRYRFDELWGLIALGGQIPDAIAMRLAPNQRSATEWRAEPPYTQKSFLARFRESMGLRLVAAARLGLRHDLPESALSALESYAADSIAGEIRVPQDYVDEFQGRFILQLDDVQTQFPALMLALGKARYGASGPPQLAKAIVERLAETPRDAKQRLLEEAIATDWISVHPPEIQNTILTDLRAHWQTKLSPEIRISVAQVIIKAGSWSRLGFSDLTPTRLHQSALAVALGGVVGH